VLSEGAFTHMLVPGLWVHPGRLGGLRLGAGRTGGLGGLGCRGSREGLTGAWVEAQGWRLQLQFSDMLTKWRRFFHHVAAEQGKAGLAAVDTKLEVAALQVGAPPWWLWAGGPPGTLPRRPSHV